MKLPRVCDLCHHQQPSLYCSSDSAFLCYGCDYEVHSANFLVARHVRVSLHNCNQLADDNDDALSSSSSSSSSNNVCTTNTSTDFNKYCKTTSASSSSSSNSSSCCSIRGCMSSDWKSRDVLVSWCSSVMAGGNNSNNSNNRSRRRRRVIEVARDAFKVWWVVRRKREDAGDGPYRVGLAGSLWLGVLRRCGGDRRRRSVMMKRLEEISGVPAEAIVATQPKLLATIMNYRQSRRHHHQSYNYYDDHESSAEC